MHHLQRCTVAPTVFFLHPSESQHNFSLVIQDHCRARGTALAYIKLKLCLVLTKHPAILQPSEICKFWLRHHKKHIPVDLIFFFFLKLLKILLNSEIGSVLYVGSTVTKWNCWISLNTDAPQHDASVSSPYLGDALQCTQDSACICMQLLINTKALAPDDLGGKWSNLVNGWLEGKNLILSLKSDWRGK